MSDREQACFHLMDRLHRTASLAPMPEMSRWLDNIYSKRQHDWQGWQLHHLCVTAACIYCMGRRQGGFSHQHFLAKAHSYLLWTATSSSISINIAQYTSLWRFVYIFLWYGRLSDFRYSILRISWNSFFPARRFTRDTWTKAVGNTTSYVYGGGRLVLNTKGAILSLFRSLYIDTAPRVCCP